MASIDRNRTTEHSDDRGPRRVDLAWLRQPVTWFWIALAGMLLVFIGLYVDAYKHNNGGGEETLLSFTNPGHLIAGIGIGVATAGVLGGLSVSMLTNLRSTNDTIRRFVPVTAAWVLAASTGIFAITYIAATGTTVGANHGHDDDSTVAASDDHSHDASEAGIAQALVDEGIDPSAGASKVDPSTVAGALTQGASGHADGKHDHGPHPTFTSFVSVEDPVSLLDQFPEGTLTDGDMAELRAQVEQVRAVADKYPTQEAAQAAGYRNTTVDVPFMGHHYLNNAYVTDGVFDPSKPEGLLFSKIDDGPPKLVGVWFLLLPGANPGLTFETQPKGFAGDLDLWHAHIGLCLGGTEGASEGVTAEECGATGGNYIADLRWMMHAWVTPETTENPAGFFAYLNEDLYEKQVAAKGFGETQTGTTP
jgi:hypothetical protein